MNEQDIKKKSILKLIASNKDEWGMERDLSDKEVEGIYDKWREQMEKEGEENERINGTFSINKERALIVLGDVFFDKKILDFEAQNERTFHPEMLKIIRETELKTGNAATQKDLSDAWQNFAAIHLKEELHPNIVKIIESAEKEYGRTMTFDEIHQTLNETDKEVIDGLTYAKFHKLTDELTSKMISDSSEAELLKTLIDNNFFDKLTLQELVNLNSDLVKLIKNGGEDVEDLKRVNKEVVQRIKGIRNGDLIEGEGMESFQNKKREEIEKLYSDRIRKKKKKGVLYYLRKLFKLLNI